MRVVREPTPRLRRIWSMRTLARLFEVSMPREVFVGWSKKLGRVDVVVVVVVLVVVVVAAACRKLL